jgi:hypothetical protein
LDSSPLVREASPVRQPSPLKCRIMAHRAERAVSQELVAVLEQAQKHRKALRAKFISTSGLPSREHSRPPSAVWVSTDMVQSPELNQAESSVTRRFWKSRRGCPNSKLVPPVLRRAGTPQSQPRGIPRTPLRFYDDRAPFYVPKRRAVMLPFAAEMKKHEVLTAKFNASLSRPECIVRQLTCPSAETATLSTGLNAHGQSLTPERMYGLRSPVTNMAVVASLAPVTRKVSRRDLRVLQKLHATYSE